MIKAQTSVWSRPPQHHGVGLKVSDTTGQCLRRKALKVLLVTRAGAWEEERDKIKGYENTLKNTCD